jgi:hypothetical protein
MSANFIPIVNNLENMIVLEFKGFTGFRKLDMAR